MDSYFRARGLPISRSRTNIAEIALTACRRRLTEPPPGRGSKLPLRRVPPLVALGPAGVAGVLGAGGAWLRPRLELALTHEWQQGRAAQARARTPLRAEGVARRVQRQGQGPSLR